MLSSVLFASALAATARAQFLSAPKDLLTRQGYAGVPVRYKQIPNGICETNPNVKSYSGYADVGPNEHIHFFFFEAREVDASEAPLVSWINGGPGSSSEIGLFQELGPCGINSKGQVYNNPYSWNTRSNLIIIDQPATVGLSYTTPVPARIDPVTDEITVLPSAHCPTKYAGQCGTFSPHNESLVPDSTSGAAPNFWKTLQGFMGAFPEYSRDGFHFATESYGGHYGPVFNTYIEQQNAHLPHGAKEIHLQSVMIGNGWYDPAIQYLAYYNFTVSGTNGSPGNTYDYRPFNASTEKQMYDNLYGKGKCLDGLAHCKATGNNTICSNADNYCANNVEEILDNAANRDEYDIRELMPDPFPYSFYYAYLNQPHVQQAIGAFVNYSDYSATVGDAFGNTGDDGREDMTIEDVQELLRQGIYVVSYAGDADYNCNWLGGQVVAEMINAPGYDGAGFTDFQTPDNIVHGQVRQAGNYAFVRVYYSGHEVPFYQPVLALNMLDRVINGLDVATGKQRFQGYCSHGPSQSTFREGIKTVQFKILPADATYNTTTGAPNPS